MGTIDATQLVDVVPSVQGAGGTAVDVIGLVLTSNTRPPIGSVLSFPSADAVSSYFGPGSHEAQIAGGGAGLGSGYFGGFTGASKIPSNILFAQYNTVNVAAYLRGGNVSSLTLTQLQAISGSLAISIDGTPHSGSPNLAPATSFSNAATIIADALDVEGTQAAAFTGSIATTVLTVSAVSTGTLAVGQIVKGSGVAADTFITSLGTGTGGTGTYNVNNSQTVGSESLTTVQPGVAYDSQSGAFVVTSSTTGTASTIAFATGTIADDLKLQAAQGAVLSQGVNAATPASFMNALVAVNRNWVTFGTAFDPDGGSGNANKQAFAAWKNSQNKRYAYVCWDTDITPTQSVPATTSLGFILDGNGDEGTCLLYEASDLNHMAFVMGTAAAIDFGETNGRISFAFRQQPGLVASVTDPTVAANLGGNPQTTDKGNGYNFYGAYANASQNFVTLQRGFVTGTFSWFDSYINQVWFNSLAQSALLNFLTNSKSVPYDDAGRAAIEAALGDPIQQGLNFGMFGPGPLSASQVSSVNSAAGANIADTLQTQGYFLQVLPATAEVRAARTTPPCKFWYIDRGSVQAITLASVALQ